MQATYLIRKQTVSDLQQMHDNCIATAEVADRPVSRGNKKALSGELALVPPLLGSSQRLLNRSHHEVYYEVCLSLKHL